MLNDPELHYSSPQADRNSHLRATAEGIKDRLQKPNTRLIPYWNGLHWLNTTTIKQPDLISIEWGSNQQLDFQFFYLGEHNGADYFSFDLSDFNEDAALELLPPGKFVDIRQHSIINRSREAPLLTYTRGLYLWHLKNKFCGVCGNPSDSINAGHARQCTSCSAIVYPRIDPAVIVLIEHLPEDGDPVCLLGRHRSGVPNMFSTLAGFVETGETLEAAVKREMLEEVGLNVDNIRYVKSQPWPFPSAIMLGFFAESKSMELLPDGIEVKEARWFTAKQLKNLVVKGELVLSREDSIARYLIRHWMDSNLS